MLEEHGYDIKSRSNVPLDNPTLARDSSGSRSGRSAMLPSKKVQSGVASIPSGRSVKFSLKNKSSSSGISQTGEAIESSFGPPNHGHQVFSGYNPRLHPHIPFNPSPRLNEDDFASPQQQHSVPAFGNSASIANRKMKNYFNGGSDSVKPAQKTFGTHKSS